MVYKIADNIISPLGETTEQTYQAIRQGQSALKRYNDLWNIHEPVVASLFDEKQKEMFSIKGKTVFESLVISSIRKSLEDCSIDVSSERTVLIISTTKGNIGLLDLKGDAESTQQLYPGVSAKRIADAIGVTTDPIVCCNACISGVSALILAMRLIDGDCYDNAIVTGAECQSEFIVSGFQSLKALSKEKCRPFDIERTGLNLGEATATMILSNNRNAARNSSAARNDEECEANDCWCLQDGAIRNDANHLSNPSKTAEGCYRAIKKVLYDNGNNLPDIINVHGTATLFNDQMESVAIKRAELSDVPTNAFKGYFGHTMGASGVMETILTMHSLENNILVASRGYKERGVSGKVNISDKEMTLTSNKSMLKLISGFGGCNAALLATKWNEDGKESISDNSKYKVTHRITIRPEQVVIDGKNIDVTGHGKAMLTEIYKSRIKDYPKFYKMDMLSRLGFVASELLLETENDNRFEEREDRAVVFFNRSSSICADKTYISSISDTENYFPSPAAFLYTLPNIVTGEIAIRNKYFGETSFYVLPQRNERLIKEIIHSTFQDSETKSVIGGWIDCEDEEHFDADIFITEKEK